MNDFQKMVVFAENGEPVNLRATPDRGSARVSKVPSGTQVEAGPEENGWRPVRFGNVSGWMMAVYLKEQETAPETVPVPRAELEMIFDTLSLWLRN